MVIIISQNELLYQVFALVFNLLGYLYFAILLYFSIAVLSIFTHSINKPYKLRIFSHLKIQYKLIIILLLQNQKNIKDLRLVYITTALKCKDSLNNLYKIREDISLVCICLVMLVLSNQTVIQMLKSNYQRIRQASSLFCYLIPSRVSQETKIDAPRVPQQSSSIFNQVLLLLLQLINSEMPRKIYDEQYINQKELKKEHTFISLKKRLKLIQLVFKEKLTIYKAAKRLKICHPTAKFIIKSYKKGKIYEYDGDELPMQFEDNIQPSADGTSPEIQNPEVVVEPSLQNHTPTVLKPCETTLFMTNIWATVDNQIVIMPFYYYQ